MGESEQFGIDIYNFLTPHTPLYTILNLDHKRTPTPTVQRCQTCLSDFFKVRNESIWILALSKEFLVYMVLFRGHNHGQVKSILQKMWESGMMGREEIVESENEVGDKYLSNTIEFSSSRNT